MKNQISYLFRNKKETFGRKANIKTEKSTEMRLSP